MVQDQDAVCVFFILEGRRVEVAVQVPDDLDIQFIDGEPGFADQEAGRMLLDRMVRLAVVKALPPPDWNELHQTRNIALISRRSKEYDARFRTLLVLAEESMSSPIFHYWDSEKSEWVDKELSIATG